MSFKMQVTKEPIQFNPVGFRGADLFNLCAQLTQEQRFEEAIYHYNDLLKMWREEGFFFKEIFRVYNNLGICHLKNGNIDEAMYLFTCALEVNPNYQQAKDNLDNLQEIGVDFLKFESQMKKQHGEAWRDIVKKDFEERAINAPSPKKIAKLTTEEIIAKLASLNVTTQQEKFIQIAESYFSSDELAEKEWYPHTKVQGWDEDFVWMAARELWRRWCPHYPNVEFLEDEIRPLLEKTEDWEDEEKEDRESLLAINDSIINLIKNFFDSFLRESPSSVPQIYETWINNSEWKVSTCLENMIWEYLHRSCFDQVEAHTELFYRISGNQKFLEFKGKAFLQSGRPQEALELYANLLAKPAKDFWPYYRMGSNLCGCPDTLTQGIEYLKQAQKLAVEAEKTLQTLEGQKLIVQVLLQAYQDNQNQNQIKPLKKELKKLKLALDEKLKEQIEANESRVEELQRELEELLACDEAIAYHRAWKNGELRESHSYQKMDSPKLGRNDPCSCGSGKKYKKCCLLQEENRRAEKIVENRIIDELRGKIMKFAYEESLDAERDKAFESCEDSMVYLNALPNEKVGFAPEEQIEMEFTDFWIHSYLVQPRNLSILELFIEKYSNLLSPDENKLLQTWLSHRFGLWEVQEIVAGEWMITKDLFSDLMVRSTGENTTRSASLYTIILGRLESQSGEASFSGPVLELPRQYKQKVMEVIQVQASQAQATSVSDFVHANPLKIKELTIKTMLQSQPRIFLDWDGYPLKNCEGVYQIKDSEEVLTWLQQREDFELASDLDDSTQIFNLLQRGPSANQPPSLKDQSSSDKRTLRTGAECINPRTGEHYRSIANVDLDTNTKQLKIFAVSEARFDYCLTLLKKQWPHLKQISEQRSNFDLSKQKQGEPSSLKEPIPLAIQEQILSASMQDHARQWVENKIPALDHQTPYQALKTSEGREKLKELLKDFISEDHLTAKLQVKFIFQELKIKPEDLGLKLNEAD